MNELRAAIHDFIAVCVYWGGAAVLWYLWYRWFMAAVEESPLVAETFLLQIVGMVVLTFVWRRVGACILNRYLRDGTATLTKAHAVDARRAPSTRAAK